MHLEMGLCNSQQLYKIIDFLNPDVIFEELSDEVFERCYVQKSMSTLETNAISAYIQNKDVKHIPVVGTIHDVGDKIGFLTKYESYRILCDELFMMQMQYGFPYLNSVEYENILDRMSATEQAFLKEKDNDVLRQIFKSCDIDIDRYENEILNNIYNYSKLNSYKSAILLLGAAHRKSVLGKIDNLHGQQEPNLNWSIFNNEKLWK